MSFKIRTDWSGWYRMWKNCAHGPKWNWWRLIWFRVVRLEIHPASPNTGYRLWIYTRWAGATYDVFFIVGRV